MIQSLVKSPTENPWGEPLTKRVMAELAGKPLAKWHRRGIIKFPCHERDPQKPMFNKMVCPEGKPVKIYKEENQQYEYVSAQQAILAKRSSHPLFSVPSVSTAMVRGPIWQEAFCTTCASMIGPKGKESALPPGFRRSLPGSKSFTVREKSCQTHMRLPLLTDTQKPHKACPCMEAKTAETKHVLPCLQEVVKESLPEDDPIHHTMLDCLKAFNQISLMPLPASQPLQSLPLHKTLPTGSCTNMMICMPGPCQSIESCSTLPTSFTQHTTSTEMRSIPTSERITTLRVKTL